MHGPSLLIQCWLNSAQQCWLNMHNSMAWFAPFWSLWNPVYRCQILLIWCTPGGYMWLAWQSNGCSAIQCVSVNHASRSSVMYARFWSVRRCRWWLPGLQERCWYGMCWTDQHEDHGMGSCVAVFLPYSFHTGSIDVQSIHTLTYTAYTIISMSINPVPVFISMLHSSCPWKSFHKAKLRGQRHAAGDLARPALLPFHNQFRSARVGSRI